MTPINFDMTPEQEKIYEDGFLAGQEQLIRSSVHRAVNRMAQREWVGLTDEEMKDALTSVDAETKRLPPGFRDFARAIETKLRSKNG